MKLKAAIGAALIVSIASALLLSSASFAQANTEKRPIVEVRCTITKAKLSTRVTDVGEAEKSHEKVYNSILQNVETLIKRAEANDYAAQGLTGAKADVKSSYDSYTAALEGFTTALSTAENTACGDSDGQFMLSLTKSRTDLVSVRTASQTLKSTIRTSLIPEIKAYAKWLEEQQPVSTSAPKSETNIGVNDES